MFIREPQSVSLQLRAPEELPTLGCLGPAWAGPGGSARGPRSQPQVGAPVLARPRCEHQLVPLTEHCPARRPAPAPRRRARGPQGGSSDRRYGSTQLGPPCFQVVPPQSYPLVSSPSPHTRLPDSPRAPVTKATQGDGRVLTQHNTRNRGSPASSWPHRRGRQAPGEWTHGPGRHVSEGCRRSLHPFAPPHWAERQGRG